MLLASCKNLRPAVCSATPMAGSRPADISRSKPRFGLVGACAVACLFLFVPASPAQSHYVQHAGIAPAHSATSLSRAVTAPMRPAKVGSLEKYPGSVHKNHAAPTLTKQPLSSELNRLERKSVTPARTENQAAGGGRAQPRLAKIPSRNAPMNFSYRPPPGSRSKSSNSRPHL